ncbi:MAG: family peptidase, partial [Akkermansiaceae bacterium]|nr:family peptidase [Akkermansiaceae bacterium]
MHPRTLCSALAMLTALPALALDYPATKKDDVIDEIQGTKVPDPYRWLEDDNSPETKAWVAEQNKVTTDFLKTIPQRDAIRDRLSKLWNYERTGLPRHYGENWFFSYNSGLQNQPVLKVATSLDGESRLLLDPNTFSADGTVSLAGSTPSEDGKLLAYSISRGGSDWNEIMVRDVATGKDLSDHLKWVKFSGMSWAKDGSGFYYGRYDEPKEGQALTAMNEFQKLYFHKIGTEQSADVLIYERKDHAKWSLGGGLTEDGRYLVIHIAEGSDPKNRVFYKDMEKAGNPVVELLPDADAAYDFVDNDGPIFYFRTDLDAPRNRVIAIDLRKPDRKEWKEIIPQGKDLLQAVSSVGDQLIGEYLRDAKSAVTAYDFTGKLIREVELPGIGSAGGFDGRKGETDTFYSYTSFTDPGAIYRYDLATGKSTLWKRPKVEFDGDKYETKQVFFPSKDGTKVPMFIVYKKGISLDGSNPTLLY